MKQKSRYVLNTLERFFEIIIVARKFPSRSYKLFCTEAGNQQYLRVTWEFMEKAFEGEELQVFVDSYSQTAVLS